MNTHYRWADYDQTFHFYVRQNLIPCWYCPSLKLLLRKQIWHNEKLLEDSLSYGMSFLLTLAHFLLWNVKGMSRISKLCLGAKPQVSRTKALKIFTIPIKTLRDLHSGTSSDVSKYIQYPSHEGRTLIAIFDVFLGNCTHLHWAEQLWHTSGCQAFPYLSSMQRVFSTERRKQEKEIFVKQSSIPNGTLVVIST